MTPVERTRWLLCMFALIEGMDQQLLPATFHVLEKTLGMSPSVLGSNQRAMCLTQSLFAPVWSALADNYPKKWLLVLSAMGWCIITIMLACISSAVPMLYLRMLHGATLASLTPLAQSIIAEVTPELERGKVFGRIVFFMMIGSIFASMCGTRFAEVQLHIGSRIIFGWRVVYVVTALLAAILAVWLSVDYQEAAVKKDENLQPFGFLAFFRRERQRLVNLATIPTFWVICVSSIFGNVPWNAFSFSTTYIQKCGFSDSMAAMIASCSIFGMAVGGLVGGLFGDWAATKSPKHGRTVVGQLSYVCTIPTVLVFMLGAPALGTGLLSAILLMGLAFSIGATLPWAGPGMNRPMLTEIVQPRDCATIVAYFTVMEGTSAAFFGSPVVGWLAETQFGYKVQIKEKTQFWAHETDFRNSDNVRALKLSILCVMVPLFLVCFLITSLLYFTYPSDKDGVKRRQSGRTAALLDVGNGGSRL